MTTVLPLHLRLVNQDWTDRVPSPAHDSLTPEDRRRYLVVHPDSYLAVTRGPEDLPPDGSSTTDDLLDAGRESLERLLGTGAFSELRPASFYIYQLERDGIAQNSIVAGIATSDYAEGRVKLHEQVRPERADHLGRHFGIVGVQSSPIAVAHRPLPAIKTIVQERIASTDPILDFETSDGLHQRVWPLHDPEAEVAIMDVMASEDLYLIDGHHRTAAALAHREAVGPGRADRVLSAIFSADELTNRAHHRMLDLGDTTDDFLEELILRRPVRVVDSIVDVEKRADHELALRARGRWYLVSVPFVGSRESTADRLENLDPVRLKRGILEPLLELEGTGYHNEMLTFRPGTRAHSALAAEADATGQVFALMRPVDVSELLAAADAGLIMPAKSTYFDPKARSGVFLRPTIDADPRHG